LVSHTVGRRELGQHRHARQQPPQHPVPDDQVGRLHRHAGTAAGHRVVGRGGQRQQHGTVAQVFTDRIGLVARHHQRGRGGTEQAPHIPVAARTGHEHALADMVARGRTRLAHAADRFIARHQRIAHAREGRHVAVPQQAFGAGGDAAPFDVDDDVAGLWFGQQQLSQRQLFRVLENDGGGLMS
jgi:hypothetical protein